MSIKPNGHSENTLELEALRAALTECREHDLKIAKLRVALELIRDCDWPGPASFMGSRADWMQKLAREALKP
jgi:hypothetical protein